MKARCLLIVVGLLLLALGGCAPPAEQTGPPQAGPAAPADPLPSWNQGAAKQAILDFVKGATTPGGAGFVPEPERVAVFDNDGTLWVEKPAYIQFLFAFDRVRAMAADHPEWASRQPFKGIVENDPKVLGSLGEKEIAQVLAATHAGITAAEFEKAVREWFATARHPRFDRPYTELTYLPQVELLAYLRANGFQTFIVSGGGVDFMRVITEQAYGIPPEQVVGTAGLCKFEMREGVPVLVKLPQVFFVDDKEGKPVGIHQFIGRRPILAFGNSDGDLQMLQYTTIGRSPSLGLLVRHDDAEREWSYDRESHIGRLDEALDEAPERGWVVVGMKGDWKKVFAFEP